jgi:formylglycine-generating enzyme required for sulfatase activity
MARLPNFCIGAIILLAGACSAHADEATLRAAERAFQQARGEARQKAAKAYVDLLLHDARYHIAAGKSNEAMRLYRKAAPIATHADGDKVREGMRRVAGILKVEAKRERLVKKLADKPKDIEAQKALVKVTDELRRLRYTGRSGTAGLASSLSLDCGNGVGLDLLLVKPGTFLMGSTGSSHSGEGPPRKVTLTKPFYMGKDEVTQEQYQAVMARNPSKFRGKKNPVEQVSWHGAVEFCKKLSARSHRTVRLPSEAEWEYACRAGTKTRYHFGNDEEKLGDYAWHSANSKGTTHPVNEKKHNSWGLHDMHGNVREWCSGLLPSSNAKTTDPRGSVTVKLYVTRGGAWLDRPEDCSSASRHRGNPPERRLSAIGFRVIVSLEK